MSDLSIITKELRELDYEAYLMAIFAPKKYLKKISSIFLLQNQLKRIRNLTDEDMVGLVRILWWQEEIAKIFSDKNLQNHYLLNEIKSFKNEINFDLLNQCFEGFRKDFDEEKNFRDFNELENYIFQTQEIFYLLALQILELKADQELQKEFAKNIATIAFYTDLLKNNSKLSHFANLRLDAKNICLKIKFFISEIEKSPIYKFSEIKSLKIKIILAKNYLKNLEENHFDFSKTNFAVENFKITAKLKIFWCFLRV